MRNATIILLLFLSTISFGQGSITNCINGQVIESATSEPYVGVSVICPESGIGCRTDWNGRFVLCIEDTIEEYRLIISYFGYKTIELNHSLIEGHNHIIIKIERDSMVDISHVPIETYHVSNSLLSDGIGSCQSHKERCYITIEDAEGVEILHASGILCNDTVFYIDNKYKEIVVNTTGLEFGRVFLYNEKGVIIGELPIIGSHQQNVSVLLGPGIYCFPDGRLVCKQGYFVFPKAKVNNEEKMSVP